MRSCVTSGGGELPLSSDMSDVVYSISAFPRIPVECHSQ